MTSSTNIFTYIKERILLSDYVRELPQSKKLTRSGNYGWRTNNVISGGDNTSSMHIDDSIGYFRMFSHGQEKGDIIELHRLLNNFSSPLDAAQDLAEQYQIDVPQDVSGEIKSGPSKKSMIKAMNKLTEMAYNYLLSDNSDSEKALEYLYDRKTTDDEIDDWFMGLIPESAKKSKEMIMKACDNNIQVAQACGIMNEKEEVNMRGRLMLPIMNSKGDTISFSARVIPGVHHRLKNAKYINTSNTKIFHKAASFYGGQTLSKGNKVVICEGNLDAVGVKTILDKNYSSVAVCGTALTEEHSPLIKDASQVILMFDGDEAGKKAASKNLWLLNSHPDAGLVFLPEGSDPWDMSREDPEKLSNLIKSPIPLMNGLVSTSYNIMDKDSFESWVKNSYQELVYEDTKRVFINTVSQITGLGERNISSMLMGGKKRKRRSNNNEETIKLSPGCEMFLRASWSLDPDMRRIIFEPLLEDWLMEWVDVEKDEIEICESSVIGLKSKNNDLLYKAQEYSPDNEEMDSSLVLLSAHLSRRVLSLLRENIKIMDEHMSRTIQPLSMISTHQSGAKAEEQLTFAIQSTLDVWDRI